MKLLVCADSCQHSVFLIVATLVKCDFRSHCPDDRVTSVFSPTLSLRRSWPASLLMLPGTSWVVPGLCLSGLFSPTLTVQPQCVQMHIPPGILPQVHGASWMCRLMHFTYCADILVVVYSNIFFWLFLSFLSFSTHWYFLCMYNGVLQICVSVPFLLNIFFPLFRFDNLQVH